MTVKNLKNVNILVVHNIVMNLFDSTAERHAELAPLFQRAGVDMSTCLEAYDYVREKQHYLCRSVALIAEYRDLMNSPGGAFVEHRALHIAYMKIVNGLAKKFGWSMAIGSQNGILNRAEGRATCSFCETPVCKEDKLCSSCYAETPRNQIIITHKDYSRTNVSSKFVYNRVSHFVDCIKQFQGKQNVVVPASVYAMIDAKLGQYRITIDSDNRHVRYSKVTRRHIYKFLKDMRLMKQYENLHLIYYTLTDSKYDIDHLEVQLVDDFKQLSDAYDAYYDKRKCPRKNFLHSQYILFQLLKKYDYACDIDDFNLFKTIERKMYHDTVCNRLFKQLHWKFTSTF